MKKILLFVLSLGLAAGLLGGCFQVVAPESSNTSSESISQSSSTQDSSSVAPAVFTVVFRQAGKQDIVKQVKEGDTLTDIPAIEQKTGYTITWNRTDFTNITENIVVETVVTANTYTITYDAGEGTASVATQTVTYDQAPGSFATATREGYNFVCWKYEGKAVQATEIWKIAGNVTLVAEWTSVAKHTVSFVQDGVETVILTVEDGDSVADKDIPLTQPKEGYTVVWEEKDLTNITDSIVVNAIATANKYTITYDANDGTASMETQEVTYDQAPGSFATATRDGYAFVAWTYEGKAVLATEIWKIANDVTLKAEWNPIATYIVSFVQDGYEPINIVATDGGSIEQEDIPATQPKVGYTVVWEEKDLTNIGENITVHAIATPNKYTITYDAGDGTASQATQEVTYDQAPGSFATATLEGYNLVCWKYDGKAVLATETWKIASDVTLVAEWAPIIYYTVSFVQDGKDTINVLVAEGGSVTASDIPTLEAKKGYTAAWEEKDLTNVQTNITVNAILTANKYIITYDAGEGTASATTQTVTYDQAPGSLATATREGYKFKGWEYNGKALSATDLWTIDSNVTLTAVWAKVYTITLELNGGSVDGVTTFTVVEGEAYSLPKPKKDWYTFAGWSYGGTTIALTGVWTTEAEGHNITLQASWSAREWTNNY